MKYSIGEISDRLSILNLKMDRISLDFKLERDAFYEEYIKYSHEDLSGLFDSLQNINTCIWDLESDIRKHKEIELGNEEVGRRAILIRDYNNNRISVKNKINILFGEGWKEVKG